MKTKPRVSVVLLTIFLLGFAFTYNLINTVMEADFLSAKKYEARDIEEVYAEKKSNPDAALVSPDLFAFLPDVILEFLPTFPSPNTLSPKTFSVLRC